MSGPIAAFPTTHWSQVARGGNDDPAVKQAALASLLSQYLPAFRAHLLFRHRIPADRVDDLVQGFACDQVIARDLIAGADRARGRFRNYLMTALDRYALKARRYERAAKRACPSEALSIDTHYAQIPDFRSDAAHMFDVAWARQVIDRAVQEMRQQCASERGQLVWKVFETRVLNPTLLGKEAPPYEQVAADLGFESAHQAANALVTAKRAFTRALRSVVGEYAANEREISAELKDLWATLSSRAGLGSDRLPAPQ